MRSKMWKRGLVIGIILMFIGASIVSAFNTIQSHNSKPMDRGNWLYVGGSGPGNYTTIQDAIDNATNGDNIFVFEGSYEEQINIDKSLQIEGESNINTYIDGGFYVSNDDTIIQNFNITHGYTIESVATGSHSFGVYVTSSNNGFYNNIFWNITGEIGDPTENGGNAIGIYLKNSNNNNISFNTFSKISGGTGGEGIGGIEDYGDGGIGSGLYLSGCTNNYISYNRVEIIQGGTGGYIFGGGSGGDGGSGIGIHLNSSTSNNILFNNILKINGGAGGGGSQGSVGGDGGMGAGLFFNSSSLNYIKIDSILSIKGGIGGSASGIACGNGGIGGIGTGCYLKSSSNNNITINELYHIDGGNGGDSTHGGGGQGGSAAGVYLDISSSNLITLLNIWDIEGGTGGFSEDVGGGQGGSAAGIYLDMSFNNDITVYNVNNIVGGEGGFAYNQGGSGYIGSGIYLQSSNNNDIVINKASDIKGGNGGADLEFGGNGGDGVGAYMRDSTNNLISSSSFLNISGGQGVGYGSDGLGYGIYLDNSSSNLIYHNNLINNELNAYDTNSNFWYNATLHEGNYWSDYTGNDSNGDGIGDTPYDIPGGNNQDLYPFMEPNSWMVPPNTPVINGPNWGIIDVEYTFCINATDPNGDNLYCIWDWGDGNITNWLGPYASGEMICVSHKWSQKGTYEIRVKLKDTNGQESDWSNPHGITIYELIQTIMFGRFTNLTAEDGFITVEAVSLWTIQFRPFQFELHIAPEKITFSDDYVGIKTKRFLVAVFNVIE